MPQLSSILLGDKVPMINSTIVVIGKINANDILNAKAISFLLHEYVKPNAMHNTTQFNITLNDW
jgi:phosphatidylserine decarboxylase